MILALAWSAVLIAVIAGFMDVFHTQAVKKHPKKEIQQQPGNVYFSPVGLRKIDGQVTLRQQPIIDVIATPIYAALSGKLLPLPTKSSDEIGVLAC